jgi:DegV family protein with EDD domain
MSIFNFDIQAIERCYPCTFVLESNRRPTMKILTDCAADLPAEEAESLGITVAPLFIQFPEGEVNSNDLSPDDFYQRLVDMQPHIPTTAQPSTGIFMDLFQKLAPTGEEILSIHISSGLSGTINSARLAAEKLKDNSVHVVDSLTLSGGQRFQVLAAARAVKAAWQRSAILERLDAVRKATEVIYTLDTLTYLARGGRIGRVQALAGSVLGIKPIIRVERTDGKYSTVGKARTINRALQEIADHLVKLYGTETALWVSVLHGKFEEQAQSLASLLKGSLNVAKLEILRVSPVLGVHTGPGVIGAAVLPMQLIEDIK